MDIDDLERIAARHWQAPETEPLGDWLLRTAAGFTGRANSALPVGDPGVPLPEVVTSVEDWYRRRDLPPMIVVPGPRQNGAEPAPLDLFLAERSWVLRPGPAFVMTAAIADIPPLPPDTEVRLDPEPDAAWLALYRYRGQDLPPIARTLMMSAPWQAFASIRRDGCRGREPRGASRLAAGRDGQHAGPRALRSVRIPRLAPLPLPVAPAP